MRLFTVTARILSLSMFGLVAFTLAPLPGEAATYAWPLPISLPLSVKLPSSVASVMDGGGNVDVTCTVTPAAGTKAGQAVLALVSPPKVPLVKSSSGDFSYDGTMKLTVSAPAAGKAPSSGDVITCKLSYKALNNAPVTFADSSPSTLKLP